jgi:predicted transcriptional regulator
MNSIRSKIKRRLQKFVEHDANGLRSQILLLFLEKKEMTIDELVVNLNNKYDISRSAIASLVGYIASKLGILKSHKESYKTTIIYSLKEEYEDLVRLVIQPSTSITG